MRCLVLEKNAIIGGGLQSFRRGTQHFDTGMHLLGGFGEGQTLRRLCDYLGIYDQRHLKDVDETMDEIFMASTGDRYEIRGSREGFAQSWARYFPQEEAGIARYVEALYRITDQLSLFHLRPSDTMAALSEDCLVPADEFIAQYIEDEHLRQLLAYMNPMYGGRAGHTPAYIHAVINVLYIEGTSRFVGNSGQLADALRQVVEEAGGEVLNRAEVTRIVGAKGRTRGRQAVFGREICVGSPCARTASCDGRRRFPQDLSPTFGRFARGLFRFFGLSHAQRGLPLCESQRICATRVGKNLVA